MPLSTVFKLALIQRQSDKVSTPPFPLSSLHPVVVVVLLLLQQHQQQQQQQQAAALLPDASLWPRVQPPSACSSSLSSSASTTRSAVVSPLHLPLCVSSAGSGHDPQLPAVRAVHHRVPAAEGLPRGRPPLRQRTSARASNLALECGNIDVALTSATAIDQKDTWYRLGVEALRQGNHQIVEFSYRKVGLPSNSKL